MQIICRCLKDEDFPVEFVEHKIFLGSGDSDTITVKAEGVSDSHALLIEEDGVLFIQDNGSPGGTYLNGRRIQGKETLAGGDTVQIGTRRIEVGFLPDGRGVLSFASS